MYDMATADLGFSEYTEEELDCLRQAEEAPKDAETRGAKVNCMVSSTSFLLLLWFPLLFSLNNVVNEGSLFDCILAYHSSEFAVGHTCRTLLSMTQRR